eukprot:jgi/Mesen1/3988/ME000210S03223
MHIICKRLVSPTLPTRGVYSSLPSWFNIRSSSANVLCTSSHKPALPPAFTNSAQSSPAQIPVHSRQLLCSRKNFRASEPHIGASMARSHPGVIALFDVDGTLTPARKEASPEMLEFMQELRQSVAVGIVGGSDLSKISEQLGKDTLTSYDYVFSENGLVAHKLGKLIAQQDLKKHLGEDKLKEFINFTLHYIADLDIPIKRGTFIEFRNGMLNVSPIGRNCNQVERDEFEEYDKAQGYRKKMVEVLKEKFAHFNLSFSIGGQISFDVFPQGWDKTFCLQYVEEEFPTIHFFGDKTYVGGNDYEIFTSDKTIGHTVTSPEDTRSQCKELFLS